MKKIRIISRKSNLALWQANFVKNALQSRYPSLEITISGITTSGDQNWNRPLSEVGGKGLFVKELEECLLQNEADLAVHSMKDLPAFLPSGLVIAAILKREDPRDAWISTHHPNFSTVPAGCRVGTSSPRRQAQILRLKPDIHCLALRGNVDTRLKKLDQGEYDGLILAVAGLNRLECQSRITKIFDPQELMSGPGQGALGIECREADDFMRDLIAPLQDPLSQAAVTAERSLNITLGGYCEVPLAAFATIQNTDSLLLQARVLNARGEIMIEDRLTGKITEAIQLGKNLGKRLLEQGAGELLK